MQKQQKHSSPRSKAIWLVSFACILFLTFVFSSFSAIRVKTITFTAVDGLEVTADEYIVDPFKPYVLLFHEQGSSRGEFSTIARRLNKLEYNCLAVDLRNGGKYNYVSNETAKQLREKHLESDINGIEQDMLAAIQYVQGKSNLPVVLFGSGANGSLSLKVALSDTLAGPPRPEHSLGSEKWPLPPPHPDAHHPPQKPRIRRHSRGNTTHFPPRRSRHFRRRAIRRYVCRQH